MRALVCEEHGPPSGLRVADVPAPGPPGPGNVRVRVTAAAVNFPDLLLVADQYQVTAPLPFVPGGEFAGVVDAVGAGVTRARPGDPVMGLSIIGAFAELIEVPFASVTPVPAGLDWVAAAAFRATHLTAYHSLVDFGDLQPGQHVVILGAAGGVGSAAVAVATRLGARVIGVTRGGRSALPLELGAVDTIAYDSENLRDRIKALTGGGADLVVDPVGGGYSEPAIRAVTWGGRFVTVGYAAGGIPRLPLNLVLLKNITVRGFTLGALMERTPEVVAAADASLAKLVSEGLRPAVWEVFDLADGVRALEAVAARDVAGKIVLKVADIPGPRSVSA